MNKLLFGKKKVLLLNYNSYFNIIIENWCNIWFMLWRGNLWHASWPIFRIMAHLQRQASKPNEFFIYSDSVRANLKKLSIFAFVKIIILQTNIYKFNSYIFICTSKHVTFGSILDVETYLRSTPLFFWLLKSGPDSLLPTCNKRQWH